jgi:hypothetical protein
VRDEGTQDVVLLGMGGSSLAPEVSASASAARSGSAPARARLDRRRRGRATSSGDRPANDAVRRLLEVGRDDRDASRCPALLGRRPDGAAFVAITDPGPARGAWQEHGFRRIFRNDPEIGGRYSALSLFGMVPAALMGADVARCSTARGAPSRPARHDTSRPTRPVARRARWASWRCAGATS